MMCYNGYMKKLLQSQLETIYGKEFRVEKQDGKFQQLIQTVAATYEQCAKEKQQMQEVLETNAQELEKANNLLIEKQELLKNVENSMEDTIFYKDLNHRYIGCNKKFEEFLNIKEEDIIGKTDFELFDKESALKYKQINEEIFKEKKKIVYKHWVRYKNKDYYVLTSKTPLYNSNGEIIGNVGVSRDITHEYKLQQDIEHKNIMLIQQNKLASMGEMIANIAHQWRQPLNTLGIVIQKIGVYYHQGLLDEQKMQEYISESLVLLNGMSETIDDFRNFFSENKVAETFDIEEAIKKSTMIINPILQKNNIKFTLLMEEKYSLFGYKNEFFQVILNLMNNAIEAVIEDKIKNPAIRINVKQKKDKVLIEVCDNGNGILHEHRHKIFDPYFTTKSKGTGLGLYMSKIIIEDHMNGSIEVNSDIFGSSFKVLLDVRPNYS